MEFKLNEKEQLELHSIINSRLSIKKLRGDIIEYLQSLFNMDEDYSELKKYIGKEVIVYHDAQWLAEQELMPSCNDGYFILENNNIALTLECFEK